MCHEVVLYARYSPTGRDGTIESCQTQFERLRDWARALGLTVVAEYRDEDASGADAGNRPGLQDALEDACNRSCVLAVYSLSRLARNLGDAIEISRRLARAKADLASLHDRIDTSNAMGKFFFHITAALAQLQREQSAEWTSDAMRRHQESGRRMGHKDRVPYGTMTDPERDNRIIPCHEEEEIIGIIRELHHAGLMLRPICAELDKRGKTRRKGKPWKGAHKLVASILKRAGEN